MEGLGDSFPGTQAETVRLDDGRRAVVLAALAAPAAKRLVLGSSSRSATCLTGFPTIGASLP